MCTFRPVSLCGAPDSFPFSVLSCRQLCIPARCPARASSSRVKLLRHVMNTHTDSVRRVRPRIVPVATTVLYTCALAPESTITSTTFSQERIRPRCHNVACRRVVLCCVVMVILQTFFFPCYVSAQLTDPLLKVGTAGGLTVYYIRLHFIVIAQSMNMNTTRTTNAAWRLTREHN